MLPELDRSIIDFERSTLVDPGPKDRRIEMTLGISAAGYYTRLLELVGDTRARSYDPLTMRRVERLIEPLAEAVG